ncbi:MAG: hypothetical protein L0215_04560 [Gemmataceae bacterium]|nr:hypothetical protein [Gemmataceae bacterium]
MAKRAERRVPCILHIPGKYPGAEGREIEPEKLESFLQMLDRQFGGSTPLGIVPGRWLSDDKVLEKEPMHRIEVSVKKKDLPLFEKTARPIGREMKQKAVYVVINYQAEARLLNLDEDDEDQLPPKAAKQ